MVVSIIDVISVSANITTVISLLILAYQIYLQRSEMKYDTYERLMSDFSATAALLVNHPEVLNITTRGSGQPKKWNKYGEDEKKAYCFFDSMLGLLERAYFAIKDLRLPQKDWRDWTKWIEDLVTNEIFMDVFNDNKELYDFEFKGEIENVIKKTNTKSFSSHFA
jgi:hypothetical protein